MDTCSLRSPTRRGHRYWPDCLLYPQDQVCLIQLSEYLKGGIGGEFLSRTPGDGKPGKGAITFSQPSQNKLRANL